MQRFSRTRAGQGASAPSTLAAPIGPLLRGWRTRRRRSQMDLALQAGVSPRHLSFIETGRARPSPETLLALAHCLDVPLRARNELLLAAGFAPHYRETPLGRAEMQDVRAALERLLAAHDPLPGVVLDRHWNVVLANRGAGLLLQMLPAHLTEPTVNIFRASLHPDGFARHTDNLAEWTRYLLAALERAVQRSGDAHLARLLDEVRSYATVRSVLRSASAAAGDERSAPTLLLPCVLSLPFGRVSLFTTLTSFGTPLDVTLEELAVELFYPADSATRQLLVGALGPT